MNVQEEREAAVRARFRREANEVFGPATYRTNSVIVQLVFFILTCIGIAATYGFFDLIESHAAGYITGVLAIGLGEFLIRRRWFGTGVESALWLGGLFALITELPSSGAPEAMLVLGAAAAIAGRRVRNPLFGAVAAMFVAAYAEQKSDLGVISAIAIALIAGLLLLREWKRPSNEWLFIAIVVLLPVFGRFAADEQWVSTTISIYALFALLMLVLAIVKHHHALLVSGAIALVIACADFGRLLTTPLEAKLALAGVLLLGGAFVITRVLRDRTTGIVVTPSNLTAIDDVLESAGTLAAAHATRSIDSSAPGEARPSGDGRFGGAGASDGY